MRFWAALLVALSLFPLTVRAAAQPFTVTIEGLKSGLLLRNIEAQLSIRTEVREQTDARAIRQMFDASRACAEAAAQSHPATQCAKRVRSAVMDATACDNPAQDGNAAAEASQEAGRTPSDWRQRSAPIRIEALFGW